MSVPNQVTHRENYRKQEAAGLVQHVGGKRHGKGKNLPRIKRQRQQRQRRRAQPPRGVPGGKTLAEMLGINLPPEVKKQAKQAAAPLEPLAPPPTANVPETAKPEVAVDPPQAAGELPPVAEIKQEDAPELPSVPQAWAPPSGPVVADEPAEEQQEQAEEEEDGAAPLI